MFNITLTLTIHYLNPSFSLKPLYLNPNLFPNLPNLNNPLTITFPLTNPWLNLVQCMKVEYQLYLPDGPVILESPVLPVMEGHNVTLSCTTKTPTSSVSSFYKDGLLIETAPTAQIHNIYNVSKSDEGLYRCSVSGLGDSPESLLAVRGEDWNQMLALIVSCSSTHRHYTLG